MMFFLLQKIKLKHNKPESNTKNSIFEKGVNRQYLNKSRKSALKRISFCLSKWLRLDASMTIEAALVVPLFLFAVVNLISIMEIYRVQGNLSVAMHCTAKQMAVHGYVYDRACDNPDEILSHGLSLAYASANVKKILGKVYLDGSPIADGYRGISWLESKIMEDGDCIDLTAQYSVEAPFGIVGFDEVDMYNHICTRAWTGYDIKAVLGEGKAADQMVYITPEGVAYHKSRSCTHLKYVIRAADIDMLSGQRNADGSIYYACESCGDNSGQTVFITEYGTRYHSTLGCNKLKRTVLAVPISEVGDRTPCSKCS